MNDTIVVGVDGSVPSLGAIRWGAARAAERGTALRLIHVLDSAETEAAVRDSEAAVEAMLRAGETVARDVASGIKISWRIARGDPLEILSSTAGDDGLLVIGTHKTGFIRGTAFGSRFLALASLVRCSIAYIPDLAGSSRAGVVVGVSGSASDDAVSWAAREAAAAQQTLILVRSRPGGRREDDTDLRRAVALARDVDTRLAIRSRVTARPLAVALVAAATRAILLVVPHPHDTISTALTHDVLLNITSPTLVTSVVTTLR